MVELDKPELREAVVEFVFVDPEGEAVTFVRAETLEDVTPCGWCEHPIGTEEPHFGYNGGAGGITHICLDCARDQIR